jgi:aquaporin TIP
MTMTVGSAELRSPDAIKASIAEFIATTFYVFVGVGSIASFIATAAGGGILLIAFAHGFAFALLIAAIGPISGGHINPAITFALVITNRISVTRGLMYIVAQLLGGVLGALLLRAFLNDGLLDQIPGAGGQALDRGVVTGPLAGVGIEALLTGLLVFTVFATAVHGRAPAALAPLAIGFAVLVIQIVSIPMTGSGANPARTFGPMLVFNRYHDIWIYYVGPLLGSGAAGLLYYLLYMADDLRPRAS